MSIVDPAWIGIQKRFVRQRIRKFALGSIPFIALIGLWQANSTFDWLPPVFIPELYAVWEAAFTLQEDCPSTRSPTFTSGRWVMQVFWFERWNLRRL